MKLILLISLAAALLSTLSNGEKCSGHTQEDCETMTSEYEMYRACMERRTKRSASCYKSNDYDCENCDCDTCTYNTCENCSEDTDCCAECCQKSSCKTYNCCHQTCRADCRSNACRTSCKKKCQPFIMTRKGESKTASQHNITTVIHLNNVINNTNLINLPINVNNTVLNNITNKEARSGRYGTGDNCCLTIGPRQCIPQKSFPFLRCFHIRKKACGPICSAPVVHYERHEICDNDVNAQQPCRQQVIYVPQPQPRCAYQSAWPYVTCGNQELQSCEGCYSHYIKREDVTRCSNFCYDDGYGLGPYYRQGPFYQPGFAHVPSCYQTGTCNTFNDFGYGYEGSFDNGFPPVYPPQSYPFVIEDCENCTTPFTWDGSQESLVSPSYKNLDSMIQWSNTSHKTTNIDVKVNPTRYAEIRIKPEEELLRTADDFRTSETTGASRIPETARTTDTTTYKIP